MNRSYILRDNASIFKAGDLVIETARPSAHMTTVHSVDEVLPVMPVTTELLLPVSHLFKNRPKYDFWAVRRQWCEDEYIADAHADPQSRPIFGKLPFHFESLGELVYYLKLIGHSSRNYLVCRFQHLPNLLT